MGIRDVDEADRLYLQRVADDCERILGAQIRLRDLSLTRGSVTVLRATYALGEHEETSEGRGESVIEAHADLRARLVVDRVRLGAKVLIERPT